MTNYVEIRQLSSYDVRNLCIANNWYTAGNCDDYGNMLNICDKDNITTADIIELAWDILLHTDIDYETRYGFTSEEFFENICFVLIKNCNTFVKLCKLC